LIGKTESTVIEWKQSLAQINDIIQTIAAFANTEGGRVFIGVTDAGEIGGVQIGKGKIEDLTNQIAQHTDPKIFPKITVKKINGKDVIIIDVRESRDHLVLAFGRPYQRVGRSTVKMSKDEYERLILDKHKNKLQFDEMICRGAALNDIDPVKVRRFLEKAKEEGRLSIPEKVSIQEALEYLKVLDNRRLNNAAILLFGKDPQKFFVQAKIRAGRIKGSDGYDFLDTRVLEGTISELREGAMRFIAEHIKKAVFFDSNQRYDRWEYPLRALEEALNNALAHRDYSANGDIQLAIYDDRIEIWNPGELPKQLTPVQLKGKHKSIPRNQFLADKLYLIKYIERWGKGTNRIVEEMRKEHLPDPVFENISGGFEITLIGPGKSFEKMIEDIKFHKIDLNDRQKKAVEFIKKEGQLTRPVYCQINDIGETYAKKEINDLIKKRVIKRMGGGKNTYYVSVTE